MSSSNHHYDNNDRSNYGPNFNSNSSHSHNPHTGANHKYDYGTNANPNANPNPYPNSHPLSNASDRTPAAPPFSSAAFKETSYNSTSATDSSGITQRYTEQSRINDRDGMTTHRSFEESGQPTIEHTTRVSAAEVQAIQEGRIGGPGGGAAVDQRVDEVSREMELERQMEMNRRQQQARGGAMEPSRVREMERQKQSERMYEELMEDEYAKREGGA